MPATKRHKKRKKPPPSVDLSNVILAGALEGAKAILPDLSREAHCRINATRERCDGVVESAGRKREALMRQADQAGRMGDSPRAEDLRKQAHEVLKAAQDKATADLLDAMAKEYISSAGVFNDHTLEVLRRTAVSMYGGETGDRLHEWRASWWELKAAAAAASQDAEARTAGTSRGLGRPRGLVVNTAAFKKIFKGHSPAQVWEKLPPINAKGEPAVSVSTVKRMFTVAGFRATEDKLRPLAELASRLSGTEISIDALCLSELDQAQKMPPTF
jgi:hypothetical protein